MLSHRKGKLKKNNLSEGYKPQPADLELMELEYPFFDLSQQQDHHYSHDRHVSLYEPHHDHLSFYPPMYKKLSYQYGYQQMEEDFGQELYTLAYGSANKSLIQPSVKHSQTTYDLKDNRSLGYRSRIGCKCKKIGCLKLYCYCFAQGKVCGKSCICYGCSNCTSNFKGIYRARLEAKLRVPNCFKNLDNCVPYKVCNCQKSQCQKKYCYCFSSGLSCNYFCNCKNCLNCSQILDRGSIKDRKRESQL